MSTVRRTRAREDTGKLLRDLLELWEEGSRLSASVVLNEDGTGRFAVEIAERNGGATTTTSAGADADTLPGTPSAKAAVRCSCCREGCPECDPEGNTYQDPVTGYWRRRKGCPIALHADDCDCGGVAGDR